MIFKSTTKPIRHKHFDLEVTLNHEIPGRNEDAIYVASFERGSRFGDRLQYTTLSIDDAEALSVHLSGLIADFRALTPKEKPVKERLKDLEPGTVFSIPKGTPGAIDREYSYVKLEGDKMLSLSSGYKLDYRDFSETKAIEVVYTPGGEA